MAVPLEIRDSGVTSPKKCGGPSLPVSRRGVAGGSTSAVLAERKDGACWDSQGLKYSGGYSSLGGIKRHPCTACGDIEGPCGRLGLPRDRMLMSLVMGLIRETGTP